MSDPCLKAIHLIVIFRTGLPPSFGAVYDSASDSEEEEDEADEDSNGKWIYFWLLIFVIIICISCSRRIL